MTLLSPLHQPHLLFSSECVILVKSRATGSGKAQCRDMEWKRLNYDIYTLRQIRREVRNRRRQILEDLEFLVVFSYYNGGPNWLFYFKMNLKINVCCNQNAQFDDTLELVSFEDVTVKFTWEKWQNLNNAQKMLYRSVMLEMYSSRLSLGQCIPKPELIFKLEQGEGPRTAEEPANKSLPVFCSVGGIIETNQKSRERHLWQVTSNGQNKASEEAEGLENTFYLYSMNISSFVVSNRNCSGVKPEELSGYLNTHLSLEPHGLCAGEQYNGCYVAGKSIRCPVQLGQYSKILTRQQEFEYIGEGKDTKDGKLLKKVTPSKRLQMGLTSCKHNECEQVSVQSDAMTKIGKATFSKKCNLTKHQATNSVRKSCKYLESRKTFTSELDLIVYQRTHNQKKDHVCIQCEKPFSTKSSLTIHQRIHTGEKPYGCSECDKTFRQKSALIVHERTHTGEKHFECCECGKAFQHKWYQRTHTGEKPYEYKECGRAFLKKSYLRMHQGTHKSDKPYEYEKCGKTFHNRLYFNVHHRTHNGEKPYMCSECGKAFYQKSDLRRHQRIHNSEKLHECKECGKAFQNKSYLKTHQKVHTGEKPYECKECGKAFQNKSYLNKHQIIQTGEKPYEYNKCGKTFQWKLVLRKHHRIHTGEKPYECIQCGKMFGYKSSLIVHELIHSGEKPYGCNVCRKTFSQKSNLSRHQRTHRHGKLC
ncbi:LOW QUALITY PROTEIN: zinc finger protein ZFP2-like [Apodemus sylvaticus]|uniref:LOW QUALITY PROTEIN: zinc finger protein ZFP2-like n=1 Tax=Apodemus sylvaticus TaxID=10129 RepID=UPI0022445B1B|nr:LOW QUALITY PROTEIN: zinc finger protein ZFP2-like [Apodemus sylvaticus]